MTRAYLMVLPAVLLAGCEDPMAALPEQDVAAAPPPASVCAQVAEELRTARAQGMLTTADGESTIEQQVWLQIPRAGQDSLVQALGFEQACAEGGAEQQVVIRNEAGQLIEQRTVATVADLTSLTQD